MTPGTIRSKSLIGAFSLFVLCISATRQEETKTADPAKMAGAAFPDYTKFCPSPVWKDFWGDEILDLDDPDVCDKYISGFCEWLFADLISRDGGRILNGISLELLTIDSSGKAKGSGQSAVLMPNEDAIAVRRVFSTVRVRASGQPRIIVRGTGRLTDVASGSDVAIVFATRAYRYFEGNWVADGHTVEQIEL